MNEHNIGDVLDVTITDKIENGLLVRLSEDFKGLVLNKEIDGDYNIGDNAKAVIIDANQQRNSIILSLKRVNDNAQREELDELLENIAKKMGKCKLPFLSINNIFCIICLVIYSFYIDNFYIFIYSKKYSYNIVFYTI